MVPDDQADLGDQSLVTRLTSLIMVTYQGDQSDHIV